MSSAKSWLKIILVLIALGMLGMCVIMAWDPDEGRIVNLKLPLWILAMGQKKVDLGGGADSSDLRRLDLDIKEIERVGPLLVVDVRSPGGERVLIWTE